MLALLVGFNQLGGFPVQAYWKLVWPTIEACGWAAVLISYTAFAPRIPAFLSMPLVGLGTISYSIYMLHFACLSVMPHWIPGPTATSSNVESQIYALKFVVPVLLPLAALSYYAVERPFLNMRVRYLREREPAPATSVGESPG
jgi:peptidoglycan/LPS O-acetylase OafA/YrhL